MKVAELRKELERRDMAADGLKVVLRERLRERLQSNENTFPSANNTLRRVVTVEYALGADGKRDYNELCVRIPTSRSHLDAFVIEADDANVDYESDVVHVSYGLHLMLDIAHSKFLKVDQIQTLLVPDFSFVDYDSLSKESMTEVSGSDFLPTAILRC